MRCLASVCSLWWGVCGLLYFFVWKAQLSCHCDWGLLLVYAWVPWAAGAALFGMPLRTVYVSLTVHFQGRQAPG